MHERDAGAATRFQGWRIGLTPESVAALGPVRPGGGVRARFAGGRVETADLLVGADGMDSTVRRQLLPGVTEIDLGLRGVIGRTLPTDRFEPLVPG